MRSSVPSRPAILLGLSATIAVLLAAPAPAAAQAKPAPAPKAESKSDKSDRKVEVYRFSTDDDDDRAVLGVSTASNAGKRDTLGVLVESVTAGGPAEKAGI